MTGPLSRRLVESSAAERFAIGAVVLGTTVRLQQFLIRRSLWVDEAALATNIVHRDFGELTEPLDRNQGAPVLFLWVMRAAVMVFGNNENALRLVPLVAGVAAIPLAYVLGRRLRSPAVGALAAVLVALSPVLIRYSTEVKQYSSDAALALVLLLLGLRVADDPNDRIALVAFGATGAVSIWASHPAVFVLAGVGLVLAIDQVIHRDWGGVLQLSAVGVVSATSAGVLYVVSLRDLGRDEFLVNYWRDGFPPQPLAVGSSARWLGSATADFIADSVGLSPVAVALLVVSAAIIVLVRERAIGAALIIAPTVVMLIAATLELYPFRGRLALFLVPMTLVVLAGLIHAVRWRWLGLALVGLVSVGAVVDAMQMVLDPTEIAAIRPVLEHVAEHMEPGDQVWVHAVTIEPARYYGPIVGLDADRWTNWLDENACAAEPNGDPYRDVTAAAGGGRVWMVFAYTLSYQPDNEVEILWNRLDAHARQLETFERTDSSAALYDFGSPPLASPDRLAPELGHLACLRVTPEEPTTPTGLTTGPFGTGSRS